MSIGTNIKKLRRERDMTQEELAELLGITANAVSQWECERTAPDITQLPALANIFRVSADVILGIDLSANDARIEKIYNEVRELWCTARREEAKKLCREALKEFPDAYLIMEELAFNLSDSDKLEDLKESISLFERIRANTSEEGAKNFATGSLCNLYMKTGQQEIAKELAESVPAQIYTKETCIRMTLRGEEWANHIRWEVGNQFDSFISELRNLLIAFGDFHPLFTNDELILLWQKVIDFIHIFYEDGDSQFVEQFIIEAYYRMARSYLCKGETESAMKSLENMQKHIEHYDNFADGLLGNHVILPKEKWYTSILVRPKDETDPTIARSVSSTSTENAAMEFLKKLSDKIFDVIRKSEQFITIAEKLKLTAHE